MGKEQRRYDILAIVFVFSMAVVLAYLQAFSLLEDETLSYRQILRTHYGPDHDRMPSGDEVIVYTDEDFYKGYGAYPLRRRDLGKIIERLAAMGAKVIGVDILMDFNSAYGEDPALEKALQSAGNVVLVSQAQFDGSKFTGVNRSIAPFIKHADSGYSNITSDSSISESIVRLPVYPEVVRSGEWPFSVKVVADYLGAKPVLGNQELTIGKHISARLDQFNGMFIDYPLLPPNGQGGTMKLHEANGISASSILFPEQGELDDLSSLIKGKIVLVGEVAAVAHDEFETPVGRVFGVEIIADEVATLLHGAPLHAASFLTQLLVAGIMMLLFLGTRWIVNPLPRNLISLAILAAFIVLATWLYVRTGLVLSMSYVMIAALLSIAVINIRYYVQERGQKNQIRSAFGQYLSPKVVAELVREPERLALGGEERELTAFFSDIAGFSTFSEQMTPTELVNVLNDYLTEMCNIIGAAEGTVDKFEGDAIIAFWGAPSLQADHARRACYAAIDMQNAMASIRDRWVEAGRAPISVRMGINSGPMVVGNMGSVQRFDYTVMGDAVNLASRLEGANKVYGSRIMISDATWRACENDVDVRELDRIRVVGKHEPVTVYELLDRKGQTTGMAADMVQQFHKARRYYLAREFKAARDLFRLCLSIDPEDGPSRIFLTRCQQLLEQPPPEDWDGVWDLQGK